MSWVHGFLYSRLTSFYHLNFGQLRWLHHHSIWDCYLFPLYHLPYQARLHLKISRKSHLRVYSSPVLLIAVHRLVASTPETAGRDENVHFQDILKSLCASCVSYQFASIAAHRSKVEISSLLSMLVIANDWRYISWQWSSIGKDSRKSVLSRSLHSCRVLPTLQCSLDCFFEFVFWQLEPAASRGCYNFWSS